MFISYNIESKTIVFRFKLTALFTFHMEYENKC